MKWKIDDAHDLPLAIIEDTADGLGVLELGARTPESLALAEKIVRAHNASDNNAPSAIDPFRIMEIRLTDGSLVFDVYGNRDGYRICIVCTNKPHAERICHELNEADVGVEKQW